MIFSFISGLILLLGCSIWLGVSFDGLSGNHRAALIIGVIGGIILESMAAWFFIRFINSIDEWYRLVLVRELTKGEIDFNTGKLICEVRFAALSRWRRDRLITLELTPFGTSHIYPFFYPYFYGGQNNMAVSINNDGNLPSHCTVRIEAETDTPHFRIIQNNEIIEQARYNVYIRPGAHAVINSDPANQEASMYSAIAGGGLHREDIYHLGERNYEYSNFITIPSGRSMFLFTARNSQFGRVVLSWQTQRELFRGS